MEAPLSAYWVRFFKAAGFSQDVATRHAVVFSNNRIQPDMLPDLDKPSLKEMGITLMGDMIAILRYAKKVVEETTCERFLVDSKDLVPSSKATVKPIIKKPMTKVAAKSTIAPKSQTSTLAATKIVKTSSSLVKPVIVKKKVLPTMTRVVSQISEKEKTPLLMKRKLNIDAIETDSDLEDDWSTSEIRKRVKPTTEVDSIGYNIIMPKGTTMRSQKILKKVLEQKKTVFDRLGDSSVTSTTNSTTDGSTTTFNITGLGKDVFKKNVNNVFNRLGDRDSKKEEQPYAGILKNGNNSAISHGILKSRSSGMVSTTISTKKVLPKSGGTMRADFEKNSRIGSKSVKQLVTSSKLSSDRIAPISAKERLGTSKQVTFNKIATVAHDKKPDVFSRLGI